MKAIDLIEKREKIAKINERDDKIPTTINAYLSSFLDDLKSLTPQEAPSEWEAIMITENATIKGKRVFVQSPKPQQQTDERWDWRPTKEEIDKAVRELRARNLPRTDEKEKKKEKKKKKKDIASNMDDINKYLNRE